MNLINRITINLPITFSGFALAAFLPPNRTARTFGWPVEWGFNPSWIRLTALFRQLLACGPIYLKFLIVIRSNASPIRPGHHQEPPEYAREVPPTHGGAEKDGTSVSGLGPPARQGTTHGRTFRPHHRVAVVVEPWDGQDPPADLI